MPTAGVGPDLGWMTAFMPSMSACPGFMGMELACTTRVSTSGESWLSAISAQVRGVNTLVEQPAVAGILIEQAGGGVKFWRGDGEGEDGVNASGLADVQEESPLQVARYWEIVRPNCLH